MATDARSDCGCNLDIAEPVAAIDYLADTTRRPKPDDWDKWLGEHGAGDGWRSATHGCHPDDGRNGGRTPSECIGDHHWPTRAGNWASVETFQGSYVRTTNSAATEAANRNSMSAARAAPPQAATAAVSPPKRRRVVAVLKRAHSPRRTCRGEGAWSTSEEEETTCHDEGAPGEGEEEEEERGMEERSNWGGWRGLAPVLTEGPLGQGGGIPTHDYNIGEVPA